MVVLVAMLARCGGERVGHPVADAEAVDAATVDAATVDAATECGNGVCEPDESHPSCPEDCPAVIQIAASSQGNLAVLEDGTAWAWPSPLAPAPGRPGKLDLPWPVRSISVGMCNTCVVAEDRTGWCWGQGIGGQLGDGLWQDSIDPVQVAGLSNIETIDVGE